jgi:hypothetical protein
MLNVLLPVLCPSSPPLTNTHKHQRAQHKNSISALLGYQVGRQVRICDSFEIATRAATKSNTNNTAASSSASSASMDVDSDGDTADNDAIELELGMFEEDIKLFKETFPKYEVLGWYTTVVGGAGGDADAAVAVGAFEKRVHEAMQAYNELPLLVLLDPRPTNDERSLPLRVCEWASSAAAFVDVSFAIDPDEAERVVLVESGMFVRVLFVMCIGVLCCVAPQVERVLL